MSKNENFKIKINAYPIHNDNGEFVEFYPRTIKYANSLDDMKIQMIAEIVCMNMKVSDYFTACCMVTGEYNSFLNRLFKRKKYDRRIQFSKYTDDFTITKIK